MHEQILTWKKSLEMANWRWSENMSICQLQWMRSSELVKWLIPDNFETFGFSQLEMAFINSFPILFRCVLNSPFIWTFQIKIGMKSLCMTWINRQDMLLIQNEWNECRKHYPKILKEKDLDIFLPTIYFAINP